MHVEIKVLRVLTGITALEVVFIACRYQSTENSHGDGDYKMYLLCVGIK